MIIVISECVEPRLFIIYRDRFEGAGIMYSRIGEHDLCTSAIRYFITNFCGNCGLRLCARLSYIFLCINHEEPYCLNKIVTYLTD